MSDPVILIVKTLGSLYVFIVLLRFILQMSRADFYNPLSQAVVKATQPVLAPIRRLVPGMGGLDVASLILAFIVYLLVAVIVVYLAGGAQALNDLPLLILAAAAGVLYALLDIYFWAMVISVILSWVAPQADHPAARLVFQITEPVYGLCRRVIPPLGGLDLSPILVFLVIQLVQSFLVHSVPYMGLVR
ncbi:YggT family protein [Pokkaliibacter sp. CJK22405]|uniref:YggT family protein n=1 Tax=Pokkaliibacter sp. CJK22405 TaxID=3384615 RepID=UPI0039854FF3